MKKINILLIAVIARWLVTLISNTQKKAADKNCNCPGTYIRLPEMFVDKATADERFKEFSRDDPDFGESKSKRLIRILEPQNSQFTFVYSFKAIKKLTTQLNNYSGIRIYFAIYRECTNETFPPTLKDNNLLLLFSLEDSNRLPLKYYFINENDDANYEVSEKCAQSWINNFNSKCQPTLRGSIIRNDRDNQNPDNPREFSDTKSMFYSREIFEPAFIKENDYQLSQGLSEITAFKFSFSAYSKKGRNDSGNRPQYKRRLFLQMDYMRAGANGNNYVFYLDDQTDFCCRKALNPKKGLNNGQLCPTYCPRLTPANT